MGQQDMERRGMVVTEEGNALVITIESRFVRLFPVDRKRSRATATVYAWEHNKRLQFFLLRDRTEEHPLRSLVEIAHPDRQLRGWNAADVWDLINPTQSLTRRIF